MLPQTYSFTRPVESRLVRVSPTLSPSSLHCHLPLSKLSLALVWLRTSLAPTPTPTPMFSLCPTFESLQSSLLAAAGVIYPQLLSAHLTLLLKTL